MPNEADPSTPNHPPEAPPSTPLTGPSAEALALVRRILESPTVGPDYDEMLVLFTEMGRLGGPLWRTNEDEDYPQLLEDYYERPGRFLFHFGRPVRAQGDGTVVYVGNSLQDVKGELAGAMLRATSDSRDIFKATFVDISPLPAEHVAQSAELARRVAQREAHEAQATANLRTLMQPLADLYREMVAEIRAIEAREQAAEEAARVAARGAAQYPRPEPQPYGVSPRGAELWVRDAVRWLGAGEADETPEPNDGGVDVLTACHAISVKHYSGAVPVEEVREIFAVALQRRLIAVLFTSGSLTKAGKDFAEVAPVAVVHYDVASAEFIGLTTAGAVLLEAGMRADNA